MSESVEIERDVAVTPQTSNSAAIPCINPATGAPLGTVPVCDPTAVQDAVERARIAQRRWAKSSFKQRRRVLARIKNHIVNNAEELCDIVVQDSGKTYENALLGEILPTCIKIDWLIKKGEKYLRPERVSPGMLAHKKAHIEYVPLGVVGCIIPWNYPMQNIVSSLAPPLMAGNAVILKASEGVAWSSEKFGTFLGDALEAEGFARDTIQILNGYGATGAALIDARVDKILFIGSVANGRRIIEASAKHLTPVVMELGGKDALIVCNDADMDKAVHSALGGCFVNLGQNCIASERLLVQSGVYDAFVKNVVAIVERMRQGVPTAPGAVDVGAITTPQQLQVIDKLVQSAKAQGAVALTGGAITHVEGAPDATFFPPTVLVNVTPDMEIAQTEVFGPVMLIMKFSTEQEAIEIANGTDFGLHSSVITNNAKKGARIAEQLEAGATCINDYGLCYLNQNLPFGGVKYSGYGRMNGRDGLRAYTNHKAVLSDRLPLNVPPKLYPVQPGDFQAALNTVRFLYSGSLRARLSALVRLIVTKIKPGS